MGLAGAGPADQHGVALLCNEAAAGEIVDERHVDRRTLKLEVVTNNVSLIWPKLPGVVQGPGTGMLAKYGKQPVVKNPLLLGK